MNKQDILSALTRLIQDLTDLREALLNDPEDRITFPTFFSWPITDLYLDNRADYNDTRRSNSAAAIAFQKACAEHNVSTIGQVIQLGRATVGRWKGVPNVTILRLSRELRARFNINF